VHPDGDALDVEVQSPHFHHSITPSPHHPGFKLNGIHTETGKQELALVLGMSGKLVLALALGMSGKLVLALALGMSGKLVLALALGTTGKLEQLELPVGSLEHKTGRIETGTLVHPHSVARKAGHNCCRESQAHHKMELQLLEQHKSPLERHKFSLYQVPPVVSVR